MPDHGAYNYVFNNPIRYIDPDGRAPQNGSPNCPWPCSVVAQRLENVYNGVTDAAQSTYDYVADKASAAGNYIKDKFYSTPSYGTPKAEDFHDSGNTAQGGYEVKTGTNANPAAGVMDTKEMEKGYSGGQIIDGPLLTPGAGGSLNKYNKGVDDFGKAAKAVYYGTQTVDKLVDGVKNIVSSPDDPGSTYKLDTIENGTRVLKTTTNSDGSRNTSSTPIGLGYTLENE